MTTRRRLAAAAALAVMSAAMDAPAQGPLDLLRNASGGETRERRPNDNIEGTIWEYRMSPRKKPADGAKPQAWEGKFRTEGEAVFELSPRLAVPSREELAGVIDKARTGRLTELRLPPRANQKRIGEYRYRNGRLRITFIDDSEGGLYGSMDLRRKKETNSVWLGDFLQKEGKKVVDKWEVEVRKLED